MKSTVIITREVAKSTGFDFFSAHAKAKFIDKDVRGIADVSEDTRFTFKVVRADGNIPQEEGIFEVQHEEGWVDTRETTKFPTVWVKAASFKKKAELKKKAQ